MRLFIVSNRMPFTVVKEEGELILKESSGGLVSGLSAYLDSLKTSSSPQTEFIWAGWPGTTIEENKKSDLKAMVFSQFHAYPVFLSEEDMDNFYHGFCNKTIWPLFHYFPSYTVYDESYWINYKKVNEIFCDALTEIIKTDDIVWIHDYHLMLLPGLLRKKMPEIPIGFFLHIPFPSYEIFQLMPRRWGKELLQGLLGADLIGFHTHDYTRYFLRCVSRILGYEHNLGQLFAGERIIKVDTFPMGIDFKKYNEAVDTPEVEKEKEEIRKAVSNTKVILSIDRLDYTKGVSNRLTGFEMFLEKNPQWHKKVILLMIIIPSRIGVEHYQIIKTEIDELVGKINGRFGSIDWTPILYQFKSIPFHQLVALYSLSHIALVTPLRDGMNLISKEYIASRRDKTGVLIISEMAGASKELGEAIIINPNHKEEIAGALIEALELSEAEQKHRNEIMQKRLKRYDVIRWANDFIAELLSIKEEQEKFETRLVSFSISKNIIKHYNEANSMLIMLDYDGTLVPFSKEPQRARPPEDVLKILKKLSDNIRSEVVIISGRDKDTLHNWFGMLNISLVAEHGVWIKEKNKNWQIIKHLHADWKDKILPMLNIYVDRLPGSFIEEKDFSIVWHYRNSDPELASVRVKELMDHIVSFTANVDIQVLQGNKVVEIKSSGINKGTAGMYWLTKKGFDFILAIGDDLTDEELFKILPQDAYTIKVGTGQSYARFCLYDHTKVLDLLNQL